MADTVLLLHMCAHRLPLSAVEAHLPLFLKHSFLGGMVGRLGTGFSARQGNRELVHQGGTAGHKAATKSFINIGQNGPLCTKGRLWLSGRHRHISDTQVLTGSLFSFSS